LLEIKCSAKYKDSDWSLFWEFLSPLLRWEQ
jgi:hypothetical protein